MAVTEQFIQIEEKYNLNSFEINGYHPWTYMRRSIYKRIYLSEQNISLTQHVHSNDNKTICEKIKKKAKLYFRSFLKLFSKNDHLKKNIDILFLNSPRRQLFDGKFECIYTDDLADIFTNSMSLERNIRGMNVTPVRTKNLAYLDEVSFFRRRAYGIVEKYLLNRKKKYKEIYSRILAQVEKPLNELYGFYQMDSNVEHWVSEMTNIYFSYIFCFKIYERLLRKLKPRLIIEICHYCFDFMVINEVAKKLGITTVELQHGAIFKEHIAYNYPVGKQIPQFPDYYFMFSEYWKKYIACPINKDNLVVVGYPYYDRCVSNFVIKSKKNTNEKVLVFLSQQESKLEELAVDTSKRVKKGWKIIFKLHPREYDNWRSSFPVLLNSGIDVVDTHDRTLYEILSESDAVVGAFSTTIFEALSLGLTAFIYGGSNYTFMNDLCDGGFATKVDDCDSLCAALENLDDENNDKNAVFFKPNALENMKKVISEFLK